MEQIIKSILHLLKRHAYLIDGKLHTLKYIGYRTIEIEVWYDSKEVKKFMMEFPMKEAISEVFGSKSQLLTGIKAPYILITKDMNINDNWYYPDDQVWLITLKGVIDTLREALVHQKRDTMLIDNYCKKHGLKI